MSDIDHIRQKIKKEYTKLLEEDEIIANSDPINDILKFLNDIYRKRGKIENIKEYGTDYVLKSKDRVITQQIQQMSTPKKEDYNFHFSNPNINYNNSDFFNLSNNSNQNYSFNPFAATPLNIPFFGTSDNYPNHQNNNTNIPIHGNSLFSNAPNMNNLHLSENDNFFGKSEHMSSPTYHNDGDSFFVSSNHVNLNQTNENLDKLTFFGNNELVDGINYDIFDDSKFSNIFTIPTVSKGDSLKPDIKDLNTKSPPKNLSGFNWTNDENFKINNSFEMSDQRQNSPTIDDDKNLTINDNSNYDYSNLDNDDESEYDYGSDQESYDSEDWAQNPDEI